MNPASSIVVRTLSERVFEVVRERIVTGKLPEEAQIRQDALAAELGVSKIPLREALARLEQEGLLTSQANRGYFVQRMSAEQANEIFSLRLSIEPAAAGHACLSATEADQTLLIQAFRRLDTAATEDLTVFAVRNREFHAAMVRPGGRLLTTQLVERLTILAERYVIEHLQPAGRDARAHHEHRELADAWMARDAEHVETLLTKHIKGTLDDLRSLFAAG